MSNHDAYCSRHCVVRIDTQALRHNLEQVRQNAPNSRILAMVKSSGYGHGAKTVVSALNCEADAFGVACLSEALEIEELTNQPIVLVEGVFSQSEWEFLNNKPFEVVIHSSHQLEWALATHQAHLRPTVWLKINTGMNRLGFTPEQAISAYQQLVSAGFSVKLMSHLACSDEPEHEQNSHQISQFNSVLADLGDAAQTSLGNSAALLSNHSTHTDWVRPGIMLFGSSPFAKKSAADLKLKAVMTFEATIIAALTLKPGDAVGYGASFIADRPMSVAIVSAGYGDGYPRAAQSAHVFAAGQYFNLIGRVSMDMLCIDITGFEAQVGVGTLVELWGKNQPIDQIARCAGTISYELMCRLSQRPQRITD